MSAVSPYCRHHFCVKLKLSFLFLIATCIALYRSLFTLPSWCVGLCAYLHTDTGILLNFFYEVAKKFIWELMLTYIFKLKTCLGNLVIVCVACLCFRLCKCLHYDSKKKMEICSVSVSSCGVVGAHFRVLGAETGWRRLTRRIHANNSAVHYCPFEFRTSSNLTAEFLWRGLHRIVVIAERERPVNSQLSVWHQQEQFFYGYIQDQFEGLNFNMVGQHF